MNVLKQQLAWVQAQLGQLTLSQKLLAACLVALAVVTLSYWGHYAATPDSRAVFEAPMSAEQSGVLRVALVNGGIPVTTGSDGRLMVPSDRQADAIAMAAMAQVLPANSTSAEIDKLASQVTLWDSAAKTEDIARQKRDLVLGQMIARFPNVASAQVKIDQGDRRSLALPSSPTAAINMTLRDAGKPAREQAVAAATLVAAAQSGLTRGNCRVIVNGRVVNVGDDASGSLGGSEILEQKLSWEQSQMDKLRAQLSYIPNVIVTVNVDVAISRLSREQLQLDTANPLIHHNETTEHSEQTTGATPASGEVGAAPNTGTSLGGAGGGSAGGTSVKSSTETTETTAGHTLTKTDTPAGLGTATGASIQIPRSYLVTCFKVRNPKAAGEPEEPVLEQVMKGEAVRIREGVASAIGLKDPNVVAISSFIDSLPAVASAPPAASAQVLTLVGGYGKEIGLGALALVAMLMVSNIVKKGASPVPAVTTDALAAQRRELEMLAGAARSTGSAEDDVVSIGGEGSSAMEAMELDDDTNQTQQMVAQVTNLVKENPDGAVNLVKRWLNR